MLIRSLIEELVGLAIRRGRSIEVGDRTTVRWTRLGCRGGGSLIVGDDSILNCRIDFDSPAGHVRIGSRCYVGASHLVCHSGISIADDVIISWGVTIVDHDSHALSWHDRQHDVTGWASGEKNWSAVAIAPVTIERRSWIGFGASILKGVRIGEGAIVGANAVVTRDVAPYTVVVGNPARVVRELERERP